MDAHFQIKPFDEPVPLLVQQPYLARSFHKPSFGAVWHRHPEIELTVVQSGWGVCNINHQVEPLEPGSVFLLGSDLPHAFVSHPATQPTSWLVFHFKKENWGSAFWQLDGMQKIARMLDQSGSGLIYKLGLDSPIKELAYRLCAEGGIGGFISLLDALSHTPTSRSINSDSIKPRRASSNTKINQIIRLVEKQVTSEISQKEIAERMNMSPQAFSRFFHQRTGRTFQHFCNEIRVAHVCADLKSGDRSIAEAAHAAGFKNIANFCRRFKQITGLTPRAYRNAMDNRA